MITLQQILAIALIPPFAIAAYILVSLLLPPSSQSPRGAKPGALLTALAVVTAAAGAHLALYGPPTLPPVPLAHVYFWAAILSLLPAAAIAADARMLRPLARLAVSGAIAWMILRRKADNADWSTFATIGWMSALAIGLTAVGEVWDLVARTALRDAPHAARISAAALPWGVALIATCAAPVVLMAGSLDVASKFIGALAASAGTLGLAAMVLRDRGASAATMAVGGTLLPVVLTHAILYSTLHWAYAPPLCLAPLGALVANLPIARSRPPFVRAAIALSGIALVAGPAAVIAVARHAHEYAGA